MNDMTKTVLQILRQRLEPNRNLPASRNGEKCADSVGLILKDMGTAMLAFFIMRYLIYKIPKPKFGKSIRIQPLHQN